MTSSCWPFKMTISDEMIIKSMAQLNGLIWDQSFLQTGLQNCIPPTGDRRKFMLYHHIPVWLLRFQPFLRLLLLAKIPNIDSDSDFHLLEGVLIFLIYLQFYPQPIVYYLTWFIIGAESNVTGYAGNIIFYLRVHAILWRQWRNRPIRIPSASFSSERSFVK